MKNVAQILRRVHLEGRLVLGKLSDTGPSTLGRSSHYAEDPHNLVFVCGSGEQRPSSVHLGHDAACRPYVDACVVCSAAQEDVGGSVPQRDDFVRKRVDGDTKCPGQTKVTKFQDALAIDEKILRLEVTMKYSILVAKVDASEQLEHEALDGGRFEGTPLAVGIHVSFQVAIHEFENKHQLVFGMDHVMESDNILVFQLLHKGYFPNRGRWRSFFRV